jgi:hypothetical protein
MNEKIFHALLMGLLGGVLMAVCAYRVGYDLSAITAAASTSDEIILGPLESNFVLLRRVHFRVRRRGVVGRAGTRA